MVSGGGATTGGRLNTSPTSTRFVRQDGGDKRARNHLCVLFVMLVTDERAVLRVTGDANARAVRRDI
jgi:hypothetical protein